jgi:L-ascorbate metabolism protein UlaG (beta-lactamase superfamily)
MGSRINFYGHATIGIETGKFHLIVDPYFKKNPSASARAEEVQADYLLVTHGHGDHLGDAIEIAKRTGAPVISNTEIGRWLEKQDVTTKMLQVVWPVVLC